MPCNKYTSTNNNSLSLSLLIKESSFEHVLTAYQTFYYKIIFVLVILYYIQNLKYNRIP